MNRTTVTPVTTHVDMDALTRVPTDPHEHGGTVRAVPAGPATGLIAQVLLLAALASTVGLSGAGWVVGVTCGVIANAALARGIFRHRADRLSPADWVTLARATLAVGVAALIADSFDRPAPVTMLVTLTVAALVLDGVDGWVARRNGTTTLGAHFDGEVDAFLILVLSVYVARSNGAWVLAIGAARYAFLAAGWLLPWMREQLPPRYWRKVVAVTQGVVLTIAAADVLPLALTQTALGVALALLAESFGRDVWWLWSNRHATPSRVAAVEDRSPGRAAAADAGRRRARVRASLSAVLTILAFLLVWVALVAPAEPSRLTPSAFVRLPLEGLVVIALALALPATARRLLAWVVGPVLGLLVLVKILDFGFFTTFDRPFDPVGDWSYAGDRHRDAARLDRTDGREPGRRRRGGARRRRLRPHDPGGASPDPGRGRPPPPVARGRHSARRRLGALLGGRCAARLRHAHRLRERRRPGHRRGTCGAGRPRDDEIFAAEIGHDRFRNTPGDQLLAGLRGKDVIVAFVESYGRVAVQDSSLSPRIDAVLDRGTKRLQAAGFSSRSAFLTSSTFGGASWLAHSTLHSGLWVDSQRRYRPARRDRPLHTQQGVQAGRLADRR